MDELPPGFPRARELAVAAARDARAFPAPRHPDAGDGQPAVAAWLIRSALPSRLDVACDRVILDHYLIGDGSKNGLRTKRTGFGELLVAAGFGEWTRLEKLWEVREVMDERSGAGSRSGELRRVQRRVMG